MALLLTSVFGVTGCGSDDGEAPAESRIKNSTGDDEIKRKYTYDDSLDSLGLSKKLYDDDINDHDSLDRDLFRLKDVDELMFEPKSGDTIYDYIDDDIGLSEQLDDQRRDDLRLEELSRLENEIDDINDIDDLDPVSPMSSLRMEELSRLENEIDDLTDRALFRLLNDKKFDINF